MLTVEIAPPERATAKLEIANEAGVALARGKPTGKGRKPLRASLRVDGGRRADPRRRRQRRGQPRRSLPLDGGERSRPKPGAAPAAQPNE